jgi:hypothetical protein
MILRTKDMKKLRVTVLAVGLLAAPPAAPAQSAMTDGLVIKIDQAAGKTRSNTVHSNSLKWTKE